MRILNPLYCLSLAALLVEPCSVFAAIALVPVSNPVGPPFASVGINVTTSAAAGDAVIVPSGTPGPFNVPMSFGNAMTLVGGTPGGSATYRFSLEGGGGPGWFRIDTSVSNASGYGRINLSTSFNVVAATGYSLTEIYASDGGYIGQSGAAYSSRSLSLIGGSGVDAGNTLGTGAVKDLSQSNGYWYLQTGAYQFAPGQTSFSGSTILMVEGHDGSQNGGSGHSIIGGLYGYVPGSTSAYNSPSIYVTVAPVTTAVPEPAEWALMTGGLSVLVFIARRNRRRNAGEISDS